MTVERARYDREQEIADAISDATNEAECRIDELEGQVQDLTNCIRFMVTIQAPSHVTAELKRWALVFGVKVKINKE